MYKLFCNVKKLFVLVYSEEPLCKVSDTLLPWQPCLGALVTAVLKCTHVLLQRFPLRLPSSASAPQ